MRTGPELREIFPHYIHALHFVDHCGRPNKYPVGLVVDIELQGKIKDLPFRKEDNFHIVGFNRSRGNYALVGTARAIGRIQTEADMRHPLDYSTIERSSQIKSMEDVAYPTRVAEYPNIEPGTHKLVGFQERGQSAYGDLKLTGVVLFDLQGKPIMVYSDMKSQSAQSHLRAQVRKIGERFTLDNTSLETTLPRLTRVQTELWGRRLVLGEVTDEQTRAILEGIIA
jgi:hypothetical protein